MTIISKQLPVPIATASSPGAMPAGLVGPATALAEREPAAALEGGAALTPGYLYRLVSAGVAAKTKADASSHLTNILGIADASGVARKDGYLSLFMDAAVTVGGAVYPSGTDGQGSHTPTAFGVFPIGVAVADETTGGVNKALVSLQPVPLIQASSIKQWLDEDALRTFGGSAIDWDEAIWMDGASTGVSGSTIKQPLIGTVGGATWVAPSKSGCVAMSAGAWGMPANVLKHGVSVLSYPWVMSIKMQIAADKAAYSQWELNGGAQFGILSTTGGKWRARMSPNGSAFTTIDLGDNNGTSLYELGMGSVGDGTIRTRFNFGPWSAPVTDANIAAVAALSVTADAYHMCDYIGGTTQISHIYWRAKS